MYKLSADHFLKVEAYQIKPCLNSFLPNISIFKAFPKKYINVYKNQINLCLLLVFGKKCYINKIGFIDKKKSHLIIFFFGHK